MLGPHPTVALSEMAWKTRDPVQDLVFTQMPHGAGSYPHRLACSSHSSIQQNRKAHGCRGSLAWKTKPCSAIRPEWLHFIPSDMQPAKCLENKQYTESAAHIETPSTTTQNFLQSRKETPCLCMRAGTRTIKTRFKILHATHKIPFFHKLYLYRQESLHTHKCSYTYRRQHSNIT